MELIAVLCPQTRYVLACICFLSSLIPIDIENYYLYFTNFTYQSCESSRACTGKHILQIVARSTALARLTGTLVYIWNEKKKE